MNHMGFLGDMIDGAKDAVSGAADAVGDVAGGAVDMAGSAVSGAATWQWTLVALLPE